MRNRGIEGLLSLRPIDRRDLAVSLTLNGSYNTNRIEKLGFSQPITQSAGLNVEGYPVDSRFYRPILAFGDANANGIIQESEITVGPDPVFLGPSLPPKQVSATPAVTLLGGRLRVSSQFDYRGGFRQSNTNEINRCGVSIANCYAGNDPKAPFDLQARRIAGISPALGATRWGYMEDASFTRWREVSVGYDLPARLAAGLKGRTASVTLAARNVAI